MLLRLSILAQQATEAVAEKTPKNPIIPAPKEILWAAVFFTLLFVAMRYVLLPPLQRLMKEREDKVRADFDAAEQAKEQIEAVRRDYEAALAGARSEADALIEHARAEADAHRAEIQAVADAEIATLRQEAQAEIVAARGRALASVHGDVVDLAVGAASAVVQRPIDRAAAVSVVEQAIRAN